MGKIFLYMAMTFDGCLSGPNGELDWFDPSKTDKELHDDIVQIVSSAESWMMGYPTGPGLIASGKMWRTREMLTNGSWKLPQR